MFYNKELAAEAGLDLSTPPATWEDLISLGEQAKGKTDAVLKSLWALEETKDLQALLGTLSLQA